jgi:two-component sensor histidine kinase
MSSYATAAARIRLSMDIDERDISIDQAIPCGLIINELLTNAIKHAFPTDWHGEPEIMVMFRVTGDTLAELIISDNGIGIPEDTVPGSADTLGLSLVPMLAQQLNGEALLERTGGTVFTIRFRPESARGN